jgi:hypothetical protein
MSVSEGFSRPLSLREVKAIQQLKDLFQGKAPLSSEDLFTL